MAYTSPEYDAWVEEQLIKDPSSTRSQFYKDGDSGGGSKGGGGGKGPGGGGGKGPGGGGKNPGGGPGGGGGDGGKGGKNGKKGDPGGGGGGPDWGAASKLAGDIAQMHAQSNRGLGNLNNTPWDNIREGAAKKHLVQEQESNIKTYEGQETQLLRNVTEEDRGTPDSRKDRKKKQHEEKDYDFSRSYY